MKNRFVLFLCLAGLALGGCATSSMFTGRGDPRPGEVIDFTTKQPLAGVVIQFAWMESVSAIVDSFLDCVHTELVMTDENGQFTVPTYRGYVPYGFALYRRGYVKFYPRNPDGSVGYIFSGDAKKWFYYMAPFKGTVDERIELLNNIPLGCSAPNSMKIDAQMEKLMYEEAASIAKTAQQMKKADNMLFSIEQMEHGSDEAFRRQHERRMRGEVPAK